jgi:hypothetical protein
MPEKNIFGDEDKNMFGQTSNKNKSANSSGRYCLYFTYAFYPLICGLMATENFVFQLEQGRMFLLADVCDLV